MTRAGETIRPGVCVVGAGCSGLVALKALRQRGVPAVAFEMGWDVGGLWVFQNSNGRGGAYRSLRINTSTTAMEFSDFPMPPGIGVFPHHRHMADYFRNYARHFDLFEDIRFGREVMNCEPIEGENAEPQGYRVLVRDHASGELSAHVFEAVVVANGHHFAPRFPNPNPASRFRGAVLHSNEYVDPTTPVDLSGKDVIVVGLGNSAVDIACELSHAGAARSVTLSVRRGAWVLPKFLFGKPIDQARSIPRFFPELWRRRIATTGLKFVLGKMSDYGLPEPDHLIGEAHPTLSSDLPPLVANGDITVASSIVHCEGNEVVFADGNRKRADAIVFATGYDVSFPFLAHDHVSVIDNNLSLFLRAFHLDHRRLFFVGLMQTVGAVMPCAEAQAELIALHLSGRYSLPPRAEMARRTARHEQNMKARFVASPRHTMQIIPQDFLAEVRNEIQAGSRRAMRRRGVPFVRSSQGCSEVGKARWQRDADRVDPQKLLARSPR